MPQPRMSLIATLVARATARAGLVAVTGLALALAAIVFAASHFSLSTSEDDLISPKLPYRQAEARLSHQFPGLDPQIVVVVDAATPELAEQSTAALTEKLAADPAHFTSVRRPDGGPFWAKEGLLFQSTADVKSDMQALIAAEPFLGPMAADPSLRGLTASLSTALQGVSAGQTELAALSPPMAALAGALEKLENGQPAAFSWQNLISKPDPRQLRKIIFVDPRLDYSQLEPGAAASDAIRADARGLGLVPPRGVSVRLTGPTPMEDDEFGSLADRALPITIVAVGAIILMLWLATRSARLILAILATTAAGLAVAAALGLAIFGTFNVISIAFIPLFVGLGIDFGIQLSVRYRSEHTPGVGNREALIAAGEGMGRPLALAAFAIAAGFLAFAPTAYIGVSQLGMIAGVGMLVALALNLTLLPALIVLAGAQARRAGSAAVAGHPSRRRDPRAASMGAGGLDRRGRALRGAAAAAALRLQPDPHARSQDPSRSPPTSTCCATRTSRRTPCEAVRPNLAAAEALAARARQLPEVSDARTLADFVPADQPAKLAAIADAAQLLDLTLNPVVTSPPPTDAEVVQSLTTTAAALRQAATGRDPASANARRLADAFDRLAKGPPALRARAAELIMAPFATMLAQIQSALAAEPVTLASLPPDVARDWITPDGQALVSISPQRRFQRRRGADPLHRRGDEDRARRHRHAVRHPRGRPHGGGGLHRGGRPLVHRDHRAALPGAAAGARRRDHHGADRADRPLDARQLRGDRPAAELRQHHRAAAAVRHRRRLPHLLRDVVALRRLAPPDLQPGAGGVLLGADHGDRIRQPLALAAIPAPPAWASS